MARAPKEESARSTRRSRAEAESTRSKRSSESTASSRRSQTTGEKPARASRRQKVEEQPVKKTRRSKAADDVNKEEAFNPLANFDDILDGIEKHVGITDGSLDSSEKRMSTGLLMQDIMLGGGITAGWYTNFGQEQSCKTTNALSIMASTIFSNIPARYYWDYEGSGEPNYAESIIYRMCGKKMRIRDVFGVRDERTGAYIIKPMIRYRTGDTAEVFFDWMSQMLRKLPDKKKIGDNWYYLYRSKDKDGKVDKNVIKIVGDKYDVSYFKKTGIYRIPAPDGTLQAIILLDSYPAMLPEVLDVDDPNDALAAQARMFSTQLRRVKGRMRSKRVAVLGVNILREVPMAMYGPSERETCGTALKQYSDVRIRHASRALSGVPYLPTAVKKGMQLEEKSVEVKGGTDKYRFIHIRADKNKLSRPYLETWLRLWITDGKGKAQGFDPVWDTFVYLMETGQAEGKMGSFRIKLEKFEAKKSIGWYDFKRLILGDRKQREEICASIGMKNIDIRKECFKQMGSGRGIELYNEHLLKANEGKTEEEKPADDSDDD